MKLIDLIVLVGLLLVSAAFGVEEPPKTITVTLPRAMFDVDVKTREITYRDGIKADEVVYALLEEANKSQQALKACEAKLNPPPAPAPISKPVKKKE